MEMQKLHSNVKRCHWVFRQNKCLLHEVQMWECSGKSPRLSHIQRDKKGQRNVSRQVSTAPGQNPLPEACINKPAQVPSRPITQPLSK